jgi:hypothetical protein
MPRSRSLVLLLIVLVSGCAVQSETGQFKPTNGLGAGWTACGIGVFGVLFPDTASRWVEWDDRSITRLAAGALLIMGSVCLADYYLALDMAGHVQSLPGTAANPDGRL